MSIRHSGDADNSVHPSKESSLEVNLVAPSSSQASPRSNSLQQISLLTDDVNEPDATSLSAPDAFGLQTAPMLSPSATMAEDLQGFNFESSSLPNGDASKSSTTDLLGDPVALPETAVTHTRKDSRV